MTIDAKKRCKGSVEMEMYILILNMKIQFLKDTNQQSKVFQGSLESS